MALELGALRDALLDAGASPDKAAKAAEEVATYENRLAGIENRLVSMDGRLVAMEAKFDGRFTRLSWMIGGVYVMGLPALWLLLRVATKIGALG